VVARAEGGRALSKANVATQVALIFLKFPLFMSRWLDSIAYKRCLQVLRRRVFGGRMPLVMVLFGEKKEKLIEEYATQS